MLIFNPRHGLKHRLSDSSKSPLHRRRPRSRFRLFHVVPRLLRLLLVGLLIILSVAGIHRHRDDQDANKTKHLPTDFAGLTNSSLLWSPPHALRSRHGVDIGDQYVYQRHLGHGHEGSAGLYIDTSDGQTVVIKIFDSPSRNAIPAQLVWEFTDYTTQWPTEIEAGMLLQHSRIDNRTAYAPLKDYFVLRTTEASGHAHWNWAMVTPAIDSGTLIDLGTATHMQAQSTETLDMHFRPAFHRLLRSLKDLHITRFCHDDIKPDNIFVMAPTHWVLGDLGNVRHASHPWHAHGHWKRENQWSDCRANDVRRALKSYLSFLRQASLDHAAFDREFYWEKRQAWSRLYWNFAAYPGGSVEEVLSMSMDSKRSQELQSADPESSPLSPIRKRSRGVDQCVARRVERELTCVSLDHRVSDWWVLRQC